MELCCQGRPYNGAFMRVYAGYYADDASLALRPLCYANAGPRILGFQQGVLKNLRTARAY